MVDRKECTEHHILQCKHDHHNHIYNTDHTSSCLSTSMNLILKDNHEHKQHKSVDVLNFQMFVNSKKTAFHFAPIFNTVKHINIIHASTIEENEFHQQIKQCNPQCGNDNSIKTGQSYQCPMSPDCINDCKSSFYLHTNRTDTLYDEDLLSSGFCSNIDN